MLKKNYVQVVPKNIYCTFQKYFLAFAILASGEPLTASIKFKFNYGEPVEKNNVFLVVKMHNLYKTTCYLRLRISKILNQGLNL